MIDLGVLDNVIGVVVVILLLSMVVQSIQTFVKKLTKIKSRQIEKSLAALFDKAAGTAPPQGAATAETVLEHFKELGRVSSMNRQVVESISKADLTKVVASVEATSLLPESVKEAVTSFLKAVIEADQALEALMNIELPPESMAKLAELREKLAPLLADATRLADASGTARAELILRDVYAIRDFPSADVMQIVADLQTRIVQTAAAAPQNAILQRAAAAAKTLGKAAGELHAKLAIVIARLSDRIASIERWYDTVMQGFEERYARHMRTWAFVISVIVAVVMNADLAQIYKRMATDDVSKQLVVSQLQAIQKRQQEQAAASGQPQTAKEMTQQLHDELDDALADYPALGLEPLKWSWWWNETSIWEKARSAMGWLIMAFLLSLGAPFWHDTLNSLFSLKNLLRNKSETQNVEQRSGEGAVQS